MAVVDSDFLTGLLVQYRALFHRDFRAAWGMAGWKNLAMMFDTPGMAVGTYEWMGTVPRMEDVSHKTVPISGLLEQNFSLVNAEYQVAIEVSRMALERDQLGLITPRINQLGLEAARFPGEQIMKLIANNANGFDGAAFFANTRVIGGSANIDNLLAGTGTTVAQIQADIDSANAVVRRFEDDQGRPMNMSINVLMVPPEMEAPVWRALNRQAGDNVNAPIRPQGGYGMWTSSGYTVICNPYLTDVNDWYGFMVGGPTEKPFIFQLEKAPVLESDTDPNSRENIINRKFLYSCYGRWGLGLSDPRFGVKVVNT